MNPASDQNLPETRVADTTLATPEPDTVFVLADNPGHSFYASWLKGAPFPVEYVSHADIEYRFPAHAALVVAHDCYREPLVTILRRAVEQDIPTLILSDGIFEYRNIWTKTSIPPGAIYQPVLGHKLACFGRSQARIVESWGNLGRAEVVGAPGLDSYQGVVRPPRVPGSPFRVLVMTGMVPFYTEEQHEQVLASLRDLQGWAASSPDVAAGKIELVWRLTGNLGQEIGVDSSVTRQSGPRLNEVLLTIDAVVSWPSTAMLEAMLLGIPVVSLDYCNLPHYVPTAWRITAREHIAPVMRELEQPSPAKRLFQDTMLHDALECTSPARPRMIALAERMMAAGQDARRSGRPLDLSKRLLDGGDSWPVAPEAASRLAVLYPMAEQFQKTELEALQIEVEYLRRYASALERSGSGSSPVGNMKPGRVERTHRLLPDLVRAGRRVAKEDQVAAWEVSIDGETCRAILLHPPGQLTFEVPTGERGRFVTAVALHPEMWKQTKSGPCEFHVRVDKRIVCAILIDPLNHPADRCWHALEIEVPANPAGVHRVAIETRVNGNTDYRWALWREPSFTWAEPATPTQGDPSGSNQSSLSR